MKRVAVIGLGMLGSTLAESLDRAQYAVTGWGRKKESLARLVDEHVIDSACESPEEAFQSSDIVVLALPIPVIMEYLKRFSPLLKKDGVITDIGSIKGDIERVALLANARFIGSHPMAGTEKSGPEARIPGLYRGATVFTVPPPEAEENNLLAVEGLWRSLGGNVIRIDSKRHDELVAFTSHISHIAASALALAVLDEPDPELKALRFAGSATGFRDTIRVAGSSPAMWKEILSRNIPALTKAMRAFETRYARMKKELLSGNFDAFEKEFGRGRDLVADWRKSKGC